MSVTRLEQLTERLGSLFRAELRSAATAQGLKLVQLQALIFLSSANRYSDTPAALTEYLGVTKGTASQTLKALERRGLIAKSPDVNDSRVQHCAVTREGRAVVRTASGGGFWEGVPGEVVEEAEASLERLLRALQRARGFRAFGVCATCRFHETGTQGARCGLTGERLAQRDVLRLCKEHEDPQSAG